MGLLVGSPSSTMQAANTRKLFPFRHELLHEIELSHVCFLSLADIEYIPTRNASTSERSR